MTARRRRGDRARLLAPVRDPPRPRCAGASRRASRCSSCSSCPTRPPRRSPSRWHGPRRRSARADRRHAPTAPFEARPRPHGRPAALIGGHARRRQERAAADAGRRARGAHPPGPARLPARRLQGRRRVQGLRRRCRTPSGWSPTSTTHLARAGAASRCRPSCAAARRCCRAPAPRDLTELSGTAPTARRRALLIVVDEFATLAREVPGVRRRASSTSPSAAAASACTWCWPRSARAARSTTRSAPTPTCASRCASPTRAESDDVIDAPDAAGIPPACPGAPSRSRAARPGGAPELTPCPGRLRGRPLGGGGPGRRCASRRSRPRRGARARRARAARRSTGRAPTDLQPWSRRRPRAARAARPASRPAPPWLRRPPEHDRSRPRAARRRSSAVRRPGRRARAPAPQHAARATSSATARCSSTGRAAAARRVLLQSLARSRSPRPDRPARSRSTGWTSPVARSGRSSRCRTAAR